MAVLYGAFSPLQPRWFNWEAAGFASTLVYSLYLYVYKGLIAGKLPFMLRSRYSQKRIGLIVVCLFVLIAAMLLSVNSHLHWINFPSNWILYKYPTASKMACLWIASLLFAITVKILGAEPRDDKIAEAFRHSFIYSERPISVIFALLFLYAWGLGEQRIKEEAMSSFFAGAIAFQMMLSNVIWMFMDDPLLAKQNPENGVLTQHATMRL